MKLVEVFKEQEKSTKCVGCKINGRSTTLMTQIGRNLLMRQNITVGNLNSKQMNGFVCYYYFVRLQLPNIGNEKQEIQCRIITMNQT